MAAVVNLTQVYNPKQSVKQVIRHIKQVSKTYRQPCELFVELGHYLVVV